MTKRDGSSSIRHKLIGTDQDRHYVRTLVRDILAGDPDACAGLYAITFQSVYQEIYYRLQDNYQTQDLMQDLYTDIFTRRGLPQEGNSFMKFLWLRVDTLCREIPPGDDRKKEHSSDEDAWPELPDSESSESRQVQRPARLTAALRKKELARLPVLETDQAELLLHSIFSRAHMPATSFPLSALITYGQYRRHRSVLRRLLIIAAIFMTFLVPVILQPPKLTVTADNSDKWRPVYKVSVKAFAEVDSIRASQGGEELLVEAKSDGSYAISPPHTGKMQITVQLNTLRRSTKTVDVRHCDRTVPKLKSHEVKDNKLIMVVTDADSGIDYENIYATNSETRQIKPESYDPANGRVTFGHFPDGTNIYVSDFAENTLHLLCRNKN